MPLKYLFQNIRVSTLIFYPYGMLTFEFRCFFNVGCKGKCSYYVPHCERLRISLRVLMGRVLVNSMYYLSHVADACIFPVRIAPIHKQAAISLSIAIVIDLGCSWQIIRINFN